MFSSTSSLVTIRCSFMHLLHRMNQSFSALSCKKISIEEDSSGQHWLCLHFHSFDEDDSQNQQLLQSFLQECCSYPFNNNIHAVIRRVFQQPSLLRTAGGENQNHRESQSQCQQQKTMSRMTMNSTMNSMMSFASSQSSSLSTSCQSSFSGSSQRRSCLQSSCSSSLSKILYLALRDDDDDEVEVEVEEDSDDIQCTSNSRNAANKRDPFNYVVTKTPMTISSSRSIHFFESYFSVFVAAAAAATRSFSTSSRDLPSTCHPLKEFCVNSVTHGTLNVSSSFSTGVDDSCRTMVADDSRSGNLFSSSHQAFASSSSGISLHLCINPSSSVLQYPRLTIDQFANFFFYNPSHDPHHHHHLRATDVGGESANDHHSNSHISNHHRLVYFSHILSKMFTWYLETLKQDAAFVRSTVNDREQDKNVISFAAELSKNPLPPILRDPTNVANGLKLVQKGLQEKIKQENVLKMKRTSSFNDRRRDREQLHQCQFKSHSNVAPSSSSSSSSMQKDFILRPSDITQIFFSLLQFCWQMCASASSQNHDGENDFFLNQLQHFISKPQYQQEVTTTGGEGAKEHEQGDDREGKFIQLFMAKHRERKQRTDAGSDFNKNNMISLLPKLPRKQVGFVSVMFFSFPAPSTSRASSSCNPATPAFAPKSFATSLVAKHIRWNVTPCPFIRCVDYDEFDVEHKFPSSQMRDLPSSTSSCLVAEYKIPVFGLNESASSSSSSVATEVKSMALIISSSSSSSTAASSLNSFSATTSISTLVENCLRSIAVKNPLIFLPATSSSCERNRHSNNSDGGQHQQQQEGTSRSSAKMTTRDAMTKRLMIQTFAPAMVNSICNIIDRSGSKYFKEEVCKILGLVGIQKTSKEFATRQQQESPYFSSGSQLTTEHHKFSSSISSSSSSPIASKQMRMEGNFDDVQQGTEFFGSTRISARGSQRQEISQLNLDGDSQDNDVNQDDDDDEETKTRSGIVILPASSVIRNAIETLLLK